MPAVQHLVLLKFKPDVAQRTIDSIFSELEELQDLIGGITYFAAGPYSSHEGRNQGFTHAFIMTFASVEARDNYLPHPEHVRVRDTIIPNIDSVIAFDFEVP
jgi:hypothetical protein